MSRLVDDTIGLATATLAKTLVLRLSQPGTTPSSVRANLDALIIFICSILGYVVTTMTVAGAATANGTALTNDVIAAQGKKVIIPPGTYGIGGGTTSVAAVDITSSEAAQVHIEALPGAVLLVNTVGKNSTNCVFEFREGVIASLKNIEVDGGTIAEIFVRTEDTSATPGCELLVRDCKIANFGWTTADSGTASITGTLGVLVVNGKRLVVENCQFSNMRSRKNGTYSDQSGKCTFIQWFNLASGVQNPFTYIIDGCTFDCGAETNEGDDFDSIHMLQQASTANGRGVISNCTFKYHGRSRRVLKFQGGFHKVYACTSEPTSTWTKTTSGATTITVASATNANPAAFGATAHLIPTGTYVTPAGLAGGTWNTLNGNEYRAVAADANSFNLFGPLSDLSTSGLGTYTAASGRVTRTDGQGMTMLIDAATAASPGVFTTRFGLVVAPHGFTTNMTVRLTQMAGGTWSTINDIEYMVEVLSPTTFKLKVLGLVDGTSLGTYTASSGTIQRVNGTSVEGHIGIDWAGSNDGRLEIEDCYLDLSGFRDGVKQSTGDGSTLIIKNTAIYGNRYDCNRTIPEFGTPEVAITNGVAFSDTDDVDSSLHNCDIFGWGRSVFVQGRNNKITNNRFYDPRMHWLQTGNTVRTGLNICDNDVFTRTQYSLNASTNLTNADFSRCSEIRNWTNLKVNRNRLINDGNSLHGTGFIQFIVNGVTGEAKDNSVHSSASCLPIKYTAGVAPLNIKTATSSAGAVTLNGALQGRITTESLTTAAGATYTLTITDDQIVAADTVEAFIVGGSNSAGTPILLSSVAAAGSVVIKVYNAHASAAFNGTLFIAFNVDKA